MTDTPLSPTEDIVARARRTDIPNPLVPEMVQRSEEEKMTKIATHFQAIMETLGLDLSDPSLAQTPERVARMYVQEIFSGLNEDAFPKISVIPLTTPSSQMIIVRSSFYSFCEHHFVPMVGTAYAAYIPNGKVIGLSKIPRILQYFARRPQLQERLSMQFADSLSTLLETEDVAVFLEACHYCVLARGVQDGENRTQTQVMKGEFKAKPELRSEFFAQINR